MVLLFIAFCSLSAVIVVAASFLAKYGDRIAQQTGMGGSVIGLVLLAGATSLPELSVGYSAVRMQAADLTVGGMLGSSLANLLILALLDLVSRRPGRVLSGAASSHALSGVVGGLLTGLILLGLLLDSAWSVLRLGPASWAVIFAYGWGTRLVYLNQHESLAEISPRRPETVELKSGERKTGSLTSSLVGFSVATAVIFAVAPHLAANADSIAEITGLGRSFVGTLLLAIVTSLPEAVSTYTAIRIGAINMGIANIFGSNAFNMVILAILDAASPEPILNIVSSAHRITATSVLIVTTVAMLSLLNRVPKRWWILEPDSALLAILIIGSLYLVYLVG
jgi:cation:H+ antiporter